MRSRRQYQPVPVDEVDFDAPFTCAAATSAVSRAGGRGIAPQAIQNQALFETESRTSDAIAVLHLVFESTRAPIPRQRRLLNFGVRDHRLAHGGERREVIRYDQAAHLHGSRDSNDQLEMARQHCGVRQIQREACAD